MDKKPPDNGWDPHENDPSTIRGFEALYELLLKRAGLSPEHIAKGRDDAEFRAILEALAAIRRGKEVLYGDYMQTHGESPTALVEHYCDVKRKFVRAQGFVAKRLEGDKIDLHELLDTYSDLAVYSVLGIKLLRHMIAKGRT